MKLFFFFLVKSKISGLGTSFQKVSVYQDIRIVRCLIKGTLLFVAVVVCCHVPFIPGTSLEPAVTPHRSHFKVHAAVLSVLCVMFLVQLSAAVNMSNVLPV
jgi:hypothetical protein